MIQCLEIGSLSDYCFFLWMSKASWGNQHGITQDNMPCSVYRWQLRLRAHNMRERAVSYTASDAAGRSVFFIVFSNLKFLVDFPIKNGDFPFVGVAQDGWHPKPPNGWAVFDPSHHPHPAAPAPGGEWLLVHDGARLPVPDHLRNHRVAKLHQGSRRQCALAAPPWERRIG